MTKYSVKKHGVAASKGKHCVMVRYMIYDFHPWPKILGTLKNEVVEARALSPGSEDLSMESSAMEP